MYRILGKYLTLLLAFIVLALFLAYNIPWYTGVSVSMFLYLGYRILLDLNNRIVYMELVAFLATLQWLIGAVLHYNYSTQILFLAMKMDIPPEEYFSFAIPATVLFVFGLLIIGKKDTYHQALLERAKYIAMNHTKTPYYLIIIGIVWSFIVPFIPSQIKFISSFINFLSYVGVLYLMFDYLQDRRKRRNLYFSIGAMLIIIINGIADGIFGGMVFSIGLSVILTMPLFSFTIRKKITYAAVGFFALALIQLVKPLLRAYTWEQRNSSETLGLSTVGALQKMAAEGVFSKESLLDEAYLEYNMARINQGALVSHVMDHVPQYEPYAEGSTVVAALIGSFIPRFLWPDKPKVGTELFEKYTGFTLRGTSMGLSPLGEAYANFGRDGGIIFMFFYGLLMTTFFNIILRLSKKRNSLVFWLPIIYLHGIKVETDINRAMGYSIRAILIILAIYVIFKYLFRIKI